MKFIGLITNVSVGSLNNLKVGNLPTRLTASSYNPYTIIYNYIIDYSVWSGYIVGWKDAGWWTVSIFQLRFSFVSEYGNTVLFFF